MHKTKIKQFIADACIRFQRNTTGEVCKLVHAPCSSVATSLTQSPLTATTSSCDSFSAELTGFLQKSLVLCNAHVYLLHEASSLLVLRHSLHFLRSATIWFSFPFDAASRSVPWKILLTISHHHFNKEERESVGELSNVCSQIVLKCSYLARIGRREILWSVNKLARSVTDRTRDCDRRLARLMLHPSHEWSQTNCHVGNTAQHCRLGLFQDSDFAGDSEDSKSTSGEILRTRTSVSYSSTESEIITLAGGLRSDGSPCSWFAGCGDRNVTLVELRTTNPEATFEEPRETNVILTSCHIWITWP